MIHHVSYRNVTVAVPYVLSGLVHSKRSFPGLKRENYRNLNLAGCLPFDTVFIDVRKVWDRFICTMSFSKLVHLNPPIQWWKLLAKGCRGAFDRRFKPHAKGLDAGHKKAIQVLLSSTRSIMKHVNGQVFQMFELIVRTAVLRFKSLSHKSK